MGFSARLNIMARFLFILLSLVLWASSVAAQCPTTQLNPQFSAPGSVFGRIDAQWNQYFGSKVDANGGVLCSPIFSGTATFNDPLISNGLTFLSGTATGLAVPLNPSDAATKSYVDSRITGIIPQTSVKWATASAVLPNSPTYNNGSSGVGATLQASSGTTLTVDGNVVALNDRILVKDQANQIQNGVYKLTQATTPWILTRVSDWDQASEMVQFSSFFVSNGTVNSGSNWVLITAGPIVVGTTNLVFQQNSASQSYQSDNQSLQLVGNVFSVKPAGTFPSGIAIPSPSITTPTITTPTITGAATLNGIPIANITTNNTTLKALTVPTAGTQVIRQGFAAAGDGGRAAYTYSVTNCSLNAGVGDGGSQVGPTVGGGCWILNPQAKIDVRVFGAVCGSSDSTAAINAEEVYLRGLTGGVIVIPCPMTVAGTVNLGRQNQGGIRLTGDGPVYFPGMIFFPGVWPPTAASPAINCTSTSGTGCLTVQGQGIEIDHLNLGNPQPAPPGSGTYVPTTFPPVVTTVASANWTGLRLHDLTFTSASQCIDLEGTPNYNTVGIAGSQWTIENIWFNACLNNGIIEHDIDNTGRISNIDYDFWWNRSNPTVTAYMKAHSIGLLWHYAANTQLNNIEFFANKIAIDQQNDTVSGGFNATFAAANIQGTNISFNEVCQAMGNENGTALITSGTFTNVILYQDTTQPLINCALNSPAAIDLSSSGGANWTITNLKGGLVQTIAAIGPNSTLHLDSVDIQGYSNFAIGAPAFKESAGSDLSLGSTSMMAIRPANASAGLLEGPGLDSTQGYMQGISVGGGAHASQGSASLLGSFNNTSSGIAAFFTPNGSRVGYVGNGTSVGINLEADTGSIFLLPNAGANTFSVGSSSGKLILNVNGIPTSCSGQPVGTIWSNGGVLQVC